MDKNRCLASGRAALLHVQCAFAQTVERRRKAQGQDKVSPAYPELARRMNVSGKVKIEVVITPDGHVTQHRASSADILCWCRRARTR